ncbi:hypothetical protein QTP70_020258 [Hemibagrus guttatus]|uniref:Uncharacterized protein n=1 Tax=Hemibagrus guttatus TaxID=175788 RepID=A0AAE0PWH5_9TELE|nr:hypothetical protein QTP70_020258 [Hemibagrus guttatus]
MEKDYRTASGKLWQTIRHLRRGKRLSANTVYSGGGELLASTGDIVGRWKEYFEDLLNPTPSVEEPETEDSERGGQGQCLWTGRPGWWSLFLRRGTGGCVPTIEGSHSSASQGKSIPEYWRGESDL